MALTDDLIPSSDLVIDSRRAFSGMSDGASGGFGRPSPSPVSFRDPAWDSAEVAASEKTGVPLEILRSIRVNGERSNGDQVSPKGARGVYQFIPTTRDAFLRKYGVDAYSQDPVEQATAAALHLRESYDRTGDWGRSVAGYNGGRSGENGTNRTVENAEYVRRVMGGLPSGGAGMANKEPAAEYFGQRDLASSPKIAPPTMGDYAKKAGSSMLRGIGTIGEAFGDAAAFVANKATGTQDFEGFNPLESTSRKIEESMTEGGRAAAADGFKGDVTDPSTWQAPETAYGAVMAGVDALGNIGSFLLPAALTGGWSLVSKAANLSKMAKAAAAAGDVARAAELTKAASAASRAATAHGAAQGAGMTYGDAANDAKEFAKQTISKMSHAELMEQTPIYRDAINSGADETFARNLVVNRAGQMGGLLAAGPGALGGAMANKLLGQVIGRRAMPSILGGAMGNRAVRAGVEGGLVGLAEGTGEVAEKMGSNAGGNIAVGRDFADNIGRDTLPEGVGGFIAGGHTGAVAGAMSPNPIPPPKPQPNPVAEAAAKPNSPLSRAAAAGNPDIAAQSTDLDAAPVGAAQDPISARVSEIEAAVGDGGLMDRLRTLNEQSPGLTQQVLGAFATAKNPNAPQALREQSLATLEGALDAIGLAAAGRAGAQWQGLAGEQEGSLSGLRAASIAGQQWQGLSAQPVDNAVDNPTPKTAPEVDNRAPVAPAVAVEEPEKPRKTVAAPAVSVKDVAGEDPKLPSAVRQRRAQLSSMIKSGFDAVEQRDGKFFLVNHGDNYEMPLENAGDAARATAIINAKVDNEAHQSINSPLNDKNPATEAQIAADNYPKPVVRRFGLELQTENPRDSVRSGVDEDGQPWSVTMTDHYGGLKGTKAADGSLVDGFFGRGHRIFVIDQINPKTGLYDEAKAMIGYRSEDEARKAYLSNYAKGWKGLGAITEMSIPEFRKWVKSSAAALPVSPTIKTSQEVKNDGRGNQAAQDAAAALASGDSGRRDSGAPADGGLRSDGPVAQGVRDGQNLEQGNAGEAQGSARDPGVERLAIDRLRRVIGKNITINEVAQDDPRRVAIEPFMDVMERKFGKRGILVEMLGEGADDGVQLGEDYYVNVDMDNIIQPLAWTIIHEFGHTKEEGPLRQEDPGLAALTRRMWDLIPASAREAYFDYLKKTGQTMGADYAHASDSDLVKLRSEMLKDFMGQRFDDREWLQRLGKEKPNLFAEFVRDWLKLLDNLIEAFKGRLNQLGRRGGLRKDIDLLMRDHIKELEAMKTIALDVAAEWAQSHRAMAQRTGTSQAIQSAKAADASFSARDYNINTSRDDDDEGTFFTAESTTRKTQTGGAYPIAHLHVPDDAVRAEGWRIGDVYVDADRRREGIASALVDAASEHFGSRPLGATSVFSEDGRKFWDGISKSARPLTDQEIEDIQAELDAELSGAQPEIESDVSDAAIRRAGIHAEDAFPPHKWSGGGDQHTLSIKGLYGGKRTVRLSIDKVANGQYETSIEGAWVGPASDESTGYVSLKGAKAFIDRQIAARELRARGYDLASSLSAEQRAALREGWEAINALGDEFGVRRYPLTSELDTSIQDLAKSMGLTEAYKVTSNEEVNDRDNKTLVIAFTDKATGKTQSGTVSMTRFGGKWHTSASTIEFKKGGLGTAFYQLAVEYLARKGLQLSPEATLSGINTYRRTEQMLAAALRIGISNAMVPHPVQRVYGFQNDAQSDAEHAANLERLLIANLRNVRELAPQFDRLRYHPETGAITFKNGRDAEKVVDQLIGHQGEKLTTQTDARAFGLGRTTLARALMTQAMLDGKFQEPESFAEPVTYSARDQAVIEYAAVEAKYKGTPQWMKAPNGKRTNLTERQWVQVRTPMFQKWFGPWEKFSGMQGGVWNDDKGEVSKVVDENGEPLVVYHGSDKGGFMAFETPGGQRRGDLGIFTTSDYDMARSYVRKGRANDVDGIERPRTKESLEGFGYQFDSESIDEDGALFRVVRQDGAVFGAYDSQTRAAGTAARLGGRVVELQPGHVNHTYLDADGYEHGPFDSEAEAVADAVENFDDSKSGKAGDQPGIYALFVNLRNPSETDFEGATWSGSREHQWVVEVGGEIQADANGTQYFNSKEDAAEFAETFVADDATGDDADPLSYVRGADDHYESTDDAVRETWSLGNDGAIIRNVIDDGGGPGGYMGEPRDVFVARRGGQLKSANWNTGEFGQSTDDLRYSAREIRKSKDGSIEVIGDADEIRAALPGGMLGRKTQDGLRFTRFDAPRVVRAIEGNANAYGRGGEVIDRHPLRNGKYIGAPEKFNTPQKLPHFRRILRSLAIEGERGRFWYEQSGQEILRMVGGDVNEARRFVALLSIYSPQAKVDANSTFALRAWAQYKAGQQINVKTRVMDTKAQNAMADVDAFWSGEKTGNFFNNLLRMIDPATEGRQGATIDMWMMRAGQYKDDAPSKTQYAFMELESNRLAAELGWEPQQVQAAIWVAMKARMENAGVKRRTEQISLERGWIHYKPGKDGSRVRVIDDAQKHRDNWLAQAMAHKVTAADTAAAKFDFSDGVRRHIGQVSWEARPGRSTGVLPGVNDAPYAQQVEFQQAVQKALHDDNGVDLLAQALGLLTDGPDILAPGVWQGEVAAGMQTQAAMAPAKGKAGISSVDANQKSIIDAYASALGLLLRQEGVGWHRPFFKGRKQDENGVELRIGRPLSHGQAKELWSALDSAFRSSGVEDWESGAGMISSPAGMRIVNFGAVGDNSSFHKLVESAASGLSFDVNELVHFSSDGDLLTNDWKANPDGASYQTKISEAGRSDLLGWLRDVLAPRVQSVFDEYSAKYGWGDPGRVAFSARDDASAGWGGHLDPAEPDLQRSAQGSLAERPDQPAAGGRPDRALRVQGAVHFGKAPGLSVLSGSASGTGIKGAEQERLSQAGVDPRLKRRVYFYLPVDGGIPQPEIGLGAHVYKADLDNLYDPTEGKIRGEGNPFELAVLNAGYDGYINREQGTAVLLNRDAPVSYEGRSHDHKLIQRRIERVIPKTVTRQSGDELVRRPEAGELGGVIRNRAEIKAAAPSFRMEFGEARVKANEAPAADAALEKVGSPFRFGEVNMSARDVKIENHDKWSIYQEKSAQIGDGFIRWVQDPSTAYVTDIQAGSKTRGRAMLEWLKSTSGTDLYAVGVVDDAERFWDRMEEDGLITGQTDEDFMSFFGRGVNKSARDGLEQYLDYRNKSLKDVNPLSVLEDDIARATVALQRVVTAMKAGKYVESAAVPIGPVPHTLRMLGAPMQMLKMDTSIVRKVLVTKHSDHFHDITAREFVEGIYRPALVLNGDRPMEVEIVSSILTDDGPIMFALKSNVQLSPASPKVTAIMSAYPKPVAGGGNTIARRILNGKLIYADMLTAQQAITGQEVKSQSQWTGFEDSEARGKGSANSGLNSAALPQTDTSGSNVSESANLVKPYNGNYAGWRVVSSKILGGIADKKVKTDVDLIGWIGKRYKGDIADVPSFSARSPIGFYSELSKQIEKSTMRQAPAAAWKTFIKALSQKGVKPDEVEWTGVNEWLDLQEGKVSKDALLDYLGANGVQVEEVMLGGIPAKPWAYQDGITGEFEWFATKDEAEAFLQGQIDYAAKNAEAIDENPPEDDEVGVVLNYRDVDAEKQNSPTKYAEYTLPGGPLSRDTEILSREGWIRMDEVQVGDIVMTRRDEDGALEWQEVEAVPEVFADKLYHFKNQSINMRVTACHNMLVKRRRRSRTGLQRVKADQLWSMAEMVAPLTGLWSGSDDGLLYGNSASDVAELIGWYISEGSAVSEGGKKSTLAISQSRKANPEKCERIEALLNRLGIKWNYVDSGPAYYLSIKTMDRGLVDVLHAQGSSRNKFVPGFMFDKSAPVLERLMEGLLLGDGCRVEQAGRLPRWTYHTNSKQLADDVQVLALMTGKRGTISRRANGLYTVAINSKQWASIDDAKHALTDYNDTAYCVTVKNHAIYVRTDGVAAFTGNSNYREVLLTLPQKTESPIRAAIEAKYPGKVGSALYSAATDSERAAWDAETAQLMNANRYSSPHWDQGNVLAHLRVNDRVDADGKRVLFVEEIQSDWGQSAKKDGFKQDPSVIRQLKANLAKAEQAKRDAKTRVGVVEDLLTKPLFMKGSKEDQKRILDRLSKARDAYFGTAVPNAMVARAALQDAEAKQSRAVPKAPFIDKTDKWLNLALKRIITMAVEGGYDKIAFTDAEPHFNRWGTERIDWAKQPDGSFLVKAKSQEGGVAAGINLEAEAIARGLSKTNSKTVHSVKELEDVIRPALTEGQKAEDLAPKIWQRMQAEDAGIAMPRREGFEAFYGDKNGINPKTGDPSFLLNVLKALAKKLGGGQMDSVTIPVTEFTTVEREMNRMRAERGDKLLKGKSSTQPGLTITDTMREKVAGGLPLFSARDPQTKTPQFKAWFGDSKVVDAEGEPLVVYRGDRVGKTSFDGVDGSSAFQGNSFFSSEPSIARGYTPGGWRKNQMKTAADLDESDGLYRVYLSIKKPLRMDAMGEGWDAIPVPKSLQRSLGGKSIQIDELAAYARRKGYDGLVVDHVVDQYGEGTQYVTFKPEQVKSAIGNNGNFDPSERDINRSARDAAELFKDYARRYPDVMFRTSATDAKDMTTITKEVGAAYGIEPPIEGGALDPRVDKSWVFEISGMHDGMRVMAPVYISQKNDAVWVNLGSLSSGMAGGAIYQIAGAYARNNGKVLIGDPDGITEAGKRRRLESMIALALKYGDTSFMRPHDDMIGWNGLQWSNNPDSNLLFMLRSAEKITSGLVPEVKEIRYDPSTAQFTRGASRVTSADFTSLAERSRQSAPPAQREGMPGSGALRLASIYNSVALPVGQPGEVRTLDGILDDLGRAENLRDSLGKLRWSARDGESWGAPEPSRFDDFVYKAQDKHIDTKRIIEAIRKTGAQIADDLNVYLQEELFHGRAAKRTKDFGEFELEPVMHKMAGHGLTMGDVEEYLHARHAEEANRIIAERNPDNHDLQDGGSGMETAVARRYLDGLSDDQRAKLEDVAADVDSIIARTRQLYADYGLESQAKVDGWASMFDHYIPLYREDKDGGMGIGQGISVKGKEVKGRTGSKRKVVDIIANIAMQREKVIVRGEKNRVAKALVGLAGANPNADFWHVGQPEMERVYDPSTNTVVERADPMYKSRPNVVVAKLQYGDEVREVAVVFNEDSERAVRMASALKNLDAGNLEGLLGVSAKITRYFAAVNTQYNPVFGVVNLIRDVQSALLNLGDTPLAGDRLRIARDTMSALRGIYSDIRAARKGKQPDSEWAHLWDEFQEYGGQTGYRELFSTSSDRANALKKILNPDAWADSKLGQIFTANGQLKAPMSQAKKGAGWIFDWLSDYNEAMENGVRLASYKAALDRGMSKEQAASLAKNLTVNFNRKGQIGQQAGAVYAFFNAAMQGTARIGQTLFDMDGGDLKTLRLSKTGKTVVYGGVLVGVAQALALAAAGFGDDDPPDFVRERSLIIPTGGKSYITIPMPLGFHVIPGFGRHATEFALSGFKRPARRAISVFGMFADSFNPIGNAGLSIQTIAPTALDPLVALTENRDWTGKPIARVSSNKALPGHTQWKDSASTVGKMVSEAINWLSGGNQYVAGAISPTPDQIDYLLGQITGGVGREASKVEQTALSAWRGEEIAPHKLPLLGRFYGNARSQASEGGNFYANANRLNELETEVKGLQKDGKYAEAMELLRSRPDAYLMAQINVAERQIQRLKREKRALIEQGADRAQIRAKEQQVTDAMARINRAVERVTEAAH